MEMQALSLFSIEVLEVTHTHTHHCDKSVNDSVVIAAKIAMNE
jgi:hypothetical protein